MDPVADKVLVCSALILVSGAHPGAAVGGASAVLVSRELAVSALREFGAARGVRIPVAFAGKAKTATQFVAIFLLLADLGSEAEQVGTVALLLAAGLSVASGVGYARVLV